MRAIASRLVPGRSTALMALIVAEGLVLGLTFDAQSLDHLPRGWWNGIFLLAPRIMPVAAAVAAAGLLVVGPRIRERLGVAHFQDTNWRVWPVLLGQLAAYAILFALTGAVFAPIPSVAQSPGPWIAAWVLVAGLTALLWLAAMLPGAAWRILIRESGGLLAASIATGLLAWAAGHYTQEWWRPLRNLTLASAAAVLRLIDASSWVDSSHYLIGAGAFSVEITTECSGYEGIGLIWIFMLAYLWWFRQQCRFPHAMLLLPLATAAVFAANILRIAALVLVGARVSEEIAVGGFHSYAGTILFLAVALGAAAAARRLAFFSTIDSRGGDAGENPAAPLLVPFLALLAANLLTGLVSGSRSELFYPVGIVIAAGALWHYRRVYRCMPWQVSPAMIVTGMVACLGWIAILQLAGHSGRGSGSPLGFVAQPWAILWMICRVAGFVMVAPMIEELAFRGYVARRLMAADFESVRMRDLSWGAIVISAAMFAVMHGRERWAAAFAAGVAYGWIAKHSGRISGAIVAHVTTNATLALYVAATGSWSMWG